MEIDEIPLFSSVDYVKRSQEKAVDLQWWINILEKLVNLLPNDIITLDVNLFIIIFIS